MEIKITETYPYVDVIFEGVQVVASFQDKPVMITSTRLDMTPNVADRMRASFKGYTLKKDGTPRSGTNYQYLDSEVAEELEASVRAALKTFEEEEHDA